MNFEIKHRPKSLADYVFATDDIEHRIQQYVAGGIHRHLLLHGVMGTGKTLLANLLPFAMAHDAQEADCLFLNASLDNSIETIRTQVVNFTSVTSFNSRSLRWVILDECEQISPEGQKALKGLLDKVAGYAMFIMTTNEIWKVHDPIKDRCEVMCIPTPNAERVLPYAQRILQQEGESVPDELLLPVLRNTTVGSDEISAVSYREMHRRLEQIVQARKTKRTQAQVDQVFV